MDAAQATVLLQLRFMVGASFLSRCRRLGIALEGTDAAALRESESGCAEPLGASELAAVTAVHRGAVMTASA